MKKLTDKQFEKELKEKGGQALLEEYMFKNRNFTSKQRDVLIEDKNANPKVIKVKKKYIRC